MKKITIFVILSILIGLVWSIVSIGKSEESQVETFSTVGKYMKPGASVNITHNIERVEVNEVANIDLKLISTLNSGDVSVKITLDDSLVEEDEISKQFNYQINEENNEYFMNLQVSSEIDGLFHIRLFVTIDGSKSRTFAIPVYVGGTVQSKQTSEEIVKNSRGERLSISNSKESIIREE